MQVLSLETARGQRSVSLRHILLATDGSPSAHLALRAAADLARRSGAALHLVTAYEFAPASVLAYAPYIGPDSAWSSFEADARELLDAEQDRVTGLGARVGSVHVAREPAFNAVMEVAAMVDADLVVVGSRELDRARRVLVGSVSDHVAHSLHRPVLIVRGTEGSWPPARVTAGFDNTRAAKGAARFAATIAHLYDDAVIELVEVEPPLSVTADRFRSPDFEHEIESQHLIDFARTLDPIAGRTVDVRAVVGEPAEALAAIGREGPGNHLVVVGSRHLGCLAHW